MTAPPPAAQFVAFARDIKLSHTVFALPWAILAMFLAAGTARASGMPASGQVALILLCMVFARTFAMAANRLLDARLDAANPRTRERAIPSGRVSQGFVVLMLLLAAAVFVTGTTGFWLYFSNPYPPALSIPVLLFLGAYPLLKRVSWLCHFYLGLALAMAPLCAWVAIAGLPPPWLYLMAGAVLTWTAGFDIIYACQDYDSDRQTGVHSIPARFGIARALWLSRGLHLMCILMLLGLGWASPLLGTLYLLGAGAAAALLIVEQSLVRANDLSRVGLAFFTLNGMVSLLVGTLGVWDALT